MIKAAKCVSVNSIVFLRHHTQQLMPVTIDLARLDAVLCIAGDGCESDAISPDAINARMRPAEKIADVLVANPHFARFLEYYLDPEEFESLSESDSTLAAFEPITIDLTPELLVGAVSTSILLMCEDALSATIMQFTIGTASGTDTCTSRLPGDASESARKNVSSDPADDIQVLPTSTELLDNAFAHAYHQRCCCNRVRLSDPKYTHTYLGQLISYLASGNEHVASCLKIPPELRESIRVPAEFAEVPTLTVLGPIQTSVSIRDGQIREVIKTHYEYTDMTYIEVIDMFARTQDQFASFYSTQRTNGRNARSTASTGSVPPQVGRGQYPERTLYTRQVSYDEQRFGLELPEDHTSASPNRPILTCTTSRRTTHGPRHHEPPLPNIPNARMYVFALFHPSNRYYIRIEFRYLATRGNGSTPPSLAYLAFVLLNLHDPNCASIAKNRAFELRTSIEFNFTHQECTSPHSLSAQINADLVECAPIFGMSPDDVPELVASYFTRGARDAVVASLGHFIAVPEPIPQPPTPPPARSRYASYFDALSSSEASSSDESEYYSD